MFFISKSDHMNRKIDQLWERVSEDYDEEQELDCNVFFLLWLSFDNFNVLYDFSSFIMINFTLDINDL